MSRRSLIALGGVLRSVGAILCGYVALIVGTTVVQEAIFGGVSYQSSGRSTLIAAGVLTPLAGVLAGAVTGSIARARPAFHALPIAVAIAVETTVLYRTGRVDGPLWFEALAGAALAVAVLAGSVLAGYWKSKPSGPGQVQPE